MTPAEVARRLERSAAAKLLRSEQAGYVLALAGTTFRDTGRVEVGESEVVEGIAAMVEREGRARGLEAEDIAKRWIAAWCDDDHRWLRRHWARGGDERLVQLRPEVERALRWVDELGPREFVGTESRFEQIVGLLRQLAGNTEADPEARIRELEAEQAKLQDEIDRIRRSGEVGVYSEVQVRERLQGVRDGVGSLLGDFREVEERFRDIGREVQDRRLEGMLAKGGIVGELLDAGDELRSSPQGQSFEAFHRLLLAPEGQDELLRLCAKVALLPEVERDSDQKRLLHELLDRFLVAADRIEGGVRSMAVQIRRVLDERRVGEDRRARELVDEIRRLALGMRGIPFRGAGAHEIPGEPELGLPLERPLWQPSVPVRFDVLNVELAQVDVHESVDRLFHRVPIDLGELDEALDAFLAERRGCNLGEMLAHRPVEQGLAELVGWTKLCARRGDARRREDVDGDIVEVRDRIAGTWKRVHIPRWEIGEGM